MRDVEEAAANGNERAQMALDVFKRTVLRYIGAYAAEMNGLDAVVFTGGIGENNAGYRIRCAEHFAFLGAAVDPEKNGKRGIEIDISKDDAKLRFLVIPTNEELVIARETKEVVTGK